MSEDKKIYKVLIIDDAFFIRNLIKRAITTKPDDDKLDYKFEVIGEAINGKEGIIQYFNDKPDIVTLDINMPDLNGIEVAKQILSKDPNAKIIAISGNLDENITQEILTAGALDYIQKPFQNAYLWEKLDKAVELIENKTSISNDTDVNLSISENINENIILNTEISDELKSDSKKNSDNLLIIDEDNVDDDLFSNKENNSKKIETLETLEVNISPSQNETKSKCDIIVIPTTVDNKIEEKIDLMDKLGSEIQFDIDKELFPNRINIDKKSSKDLSDDTKTDEFQPFKLDTDKYQNIINDNENIISEDNLNKNEDTEIIQSTEPEIIQSTEPEIEVPDDNNDDTFFIIDSGDISDIEFKINTTSKDIEETNNILIIEDTSGDRETNILNKIIQPLKEDIQIDDKLPETTQNNVQPYENIQNDEPLCENTQDDRRLNMGKTFNEELNLDTSKYNTTNDQISNLNGEKNISSNKIAPPRSKVLKEIYSKKVLNEHDTEFNNDEDLNENNQNEKNKFSIFSPLKKLFSKK